MTKFKALISGHMWDDVDEQGIEIFTQVNDDYFGTDVFDEVETALVEQIDIEGYDDYFFVAIVEAEYINYSSGMEPPEYDVEYRVKVIDSLDDLEGVFL